MKIHMLGTGDAFSAVQYNTSFVVEEEGFYLMIDCPHPIFKVLKENAPQLDVKNLNSVFITHLHGDHVNGLEGFLFYKRCVEQQGVDVWGHKEDISDLWPHRLECSMGKSYQGNNKWLRVYQSEYYDERVVLRRIGPLSIDIWRTKHHIPCSAFLLRNKNKTLGFSSDTAYDPELILWLSQADLIIHETNLGEGHTPYEKLIQLPQEIKSKMRLVHYPDFFDWRNSEIACLRDGDQIEISNGRIHEQKRG